MCMRIVPPPAGIPDTPGAVFPDQRLPELHRLPQPSVWLVHSGTEVLPTDAVPELHRALEMGAEWGGVYQ